MPGPLDAVTTVKDPTRYGALTMGGEQFTGLWTQRSPYRDAATAYLIRKFYSGSRFDSILDGINREITLALTDKRRPGSSVFNSATLPAAVNFQSFKYVQDGTEKIKVLEDTSGALLNISNGSGYQTVLTKSAGAKATRGQSLGPTYYMANGVDANKWIEGGSSWKAAQNFAPGTLINEGTDPGTLQMALGGITMTVAAVASDGAGTVTVYILPATIPNNFTNLEGVSIGFAGLTTATYLNGNSYPVAKIVSTTSGIFTIALAESASAETADTGTATTGNGTSAGTAPTWSSTQFAVTADGGQQWKCYGSAVKNWGLAPITAAPTITAQNGARFWLPNIDLSAGYAILDSNGDVEIATAGKTGLSYPIWTVQKLGTSYAVVSATQIANLALARAFYASSGDPRTTPPVAPYIYQNTSGVAVLVTVAGDRGGGGFWGAVYCDGSSSPTTLVAEFSRVNAGSSPPNYYPGSVSFLVPPGFYYGISVTSGGPPTVQTWTEWALNGASSAVPGSSTGAGSTGGPTQTPDGSLTWGNYGSPGSWQAATSFDGPWDPVAPVGVILDSNGNWQYVTAGNGGASGASAPTWATTAGSTTVDGALTWTCLGPGIIWTFANVGYSVATHAIDGSVCTASPQSVIQGPIVGAPVSTSPVFLKVSSPYSPDTQIDQLWIFRTAQGQATAVFEDALAADSLAGSFIYGELGISDTSTGGSPALNALIAAPQNSSNNPPPAGMTGPVYYLQRMWAFAGNIVYHSGGPDTTTGNGQTAWAPLDSFTYPGAVVRLLPVTVQDGGILVFTSSGVHIILGTGTASDPFYTTKWCDKVNLANYDALDAMGTQICLMEANLKVSMLGVEYPFNPQSGYAEIGFPIGDQFKKVTTGGISSALYTAAGTFLSWNTAGSGDTGMYVADGAVGWLRMANISPPEAGTFWSPRAAIAGGTSAVQSVETAPGVYTLLIGPPAGGGPVLMRDQTGAVWDDNGTAFAAWDAKGVIQLCSTGAVAELSWIATKSAATGARPKLAVLMGEIAAINGATWTNLEATQPDPADQPASVSVYSDRYSGQQGAAVTKSDYVLVKFDYGAQAYGDELLEFQIFGAKEDERKEAGAGGT